MVLAYHEAERLRHEGRSDRRISCWGSMPARGAERRRMSVKDLGFNLADAREKLSTCCFPSAPAPSRPAHYRTRRLPKGVEVLAEKSAQPRPQLRGQRASALGDMRDRDGSPLRPCVKAVWSQRQCGLPVVRLLGPPHSPGNHQQLLPLQMSGGLLGRAIFGLSHFFRRSPSEH